MSEVLIAAAEGAVTPVHTLWAEDLAAHMAGGRAHVARLAAQAQFKAAAAQVLIVPTAEGGIDRVLLGLGTRPTSGRCDPMLVRALPGRLPAGDYRFQGEMQGGPLGAAAALAWALGTYRFDRFKRPAETPAPPRLVTGPGVDTAAVLETAHALALGRDMINTPANAMGPLQIETIAREIAERFGARIEVAVDEALAQDYPAVHAVGAAAAPGREPRMIEIVWDGPSEPHPDRPRPLIALVGKGVTFDTGGLDIKTAGMKLMKKDMGGAAHVLALARMIMAAGLPVRLAVLIPVAENALGGGAMRPSDVIASRAGLSIEVGNTDAEGRLILADALTRAGELSPDLTLDLATLTGAARTALGPQVVPYFTDDEALADQIARASHAAFDPLWRLPLWDGYEPALDSDVADLRNDPDAWAQAGSVTAGLFLRRFAPAGAWAHFDIYAWNPRARPGWPVGAEMQAVRALFTLIQERCA